LYICKMLEEFKEITKKKKNFIIRKIIYFSKYNTQFSKDVSFVFYFAENFIVFFLY
jgi:hypothetical protein